MSIKKAYNSWAAIYDTNENKTRDLDQKATIETLTKYEFQDMLELGCGTGKNTAWLVQHANRIVGLDFSEEMLNKAKSKITDPKVTFQQADLTESWKVADQGFDLITSSLTLEHIEDLHHIFAQAHQKLKSKGYFFISELHPMRQYLGSKAKYETESGIQELQVYVHHTSEFMKAATGNGFVLVELNEWFDTGETDAVPRLISFVFSKR